MNRPISNSAIQNSIIVTRLLKVTIKSASAVFVFAGSASVPQASSPAFGDIIKRRIRCKKALDGKNHLLKLSYKFIIGFDLRFDSKPNGGSYW